VRLRQKARGKRSETCPPLRRVLGFRTTTLELGRGTGGVERGVMVYHNISSNVR